MRVRAVALSMLVSVLQPGHTMGSGVGDQSQEPSLMVKRLGPTTLVRVARDGRVTDTIYRSGSSEILHISLARTGRFVAVLERGDRQANSTRLVVLSVGGDVVRIIDRDVRPYTWCCDGEQIALIAGPYAEDDIGFAPTGAYLVDIARGTERRLQVPQDVYEVAWAPFDSAVYFKTTRGYPGSSIVRYDPRTGEATRTTYRDLRFSPTGAYYLHYFPDVTFGPPGPHIFERETGREVPLPPPSLGAIEDWVFDQGDYLQLKRARYPQRQGMIRGPEVIDGYTIYDVRRGTVAARVQDSIRTDVMGPSGTVILTMDGELKVIRGPGEIRQ